MTTQDTQAVWYSPTQAAAIAGVCRPVIYTWIKQGLPATRRRYHGIKTRLEVRSTDLAAWLERAGSDENQG